MLWFKNKNSYRNGLVNLALLLLIIFGLIIFAAWLGYNIGINASEGIGQKFEGAAVFSPADSQEVFLAAISLAENAGLAQASGVAKLNAKTGQAEIDVIIPDGKTLPEKSVLEAWLVDAGAGGGLGEASVSASDERYGTPFANTDFAQDLNHSPFPHSLGKLEWREERGSFYRFSGSNNNYSPYDAVMITLEADGNEGKYDPRPGTPILVGKIE